MKIKSYGTILQVFGLISLNIYVDITLYINTYNYKLHLLLFSSQTSKYEVGNFRMSCCIL